MSLSPNKGRMSALLLKLDKVEQISIFDAIFFIKKEKMLNFQKFSWKTKKAVAA